MEYILETHGLTKVFKEKVVVDHVDMHINKGEIYGFVGPNGAGKSTILKMLLNLISPTQGEIRLFGTPVGKNNYELLKRMGSIIENPYFYDNLTAWENLNIHCEYMGLHNKKQIEETLKMVNLLDVGKKKVKHFSLGMKQRLAIARAILTRPEFLILDEPINALDPEGIKEMRGLFQKVNREWGTTILISSHILSEMELIADKIGVIKHGKLLKETSIEDIHQYCTEYIEIEVNDTKKASYFLEEKLNIQSIQIINQNQLHIYDMSKKGSEIASILVENGMALESMRRQENTLEDYFFQLTGEDEK